MTARDAALLDTLRLVRTHAIGPATYHALLALTGSPTAALAAAPDLARRGGRTERLFIPSRAEAERELDKLERLGGFALAHSDPRFPRLLRGLDPVPPLLFGLGDPARLCRRWIGIVGARNASGNGRAIAAEIAADLGRAGFGIVSGLARGIDAAAHEASLATGTAAFLAGGADCPYPPENQKLYERMCAEGLVLSERALGHVGRAQDFPRRNRLIAGLAEGLVVVEAALRSGSLITARIAGEIGRDVFAVPGSPLDARARGTNGLIKDGARLVESAEDVLEGLPSSSSEGLGEPSDQSPGPLFDVADDDIALAQVRRAVTELIGPSPIEIDQIIRMSGCSAASVQVVLLELELAGRLIREGGQKVALRSA